MWSLNLGNIHLASVNSVIEKDSSSIDEYERFHLQIEKIGLEVFGIQSINSHSSFLRKTSLLELWKKYD